MESGWAMHNFTSRVDWKLRGIRWVSASSSYFSLHEGNKKSAVAYRYSLGSGHPYHVNAWLGVSLGYSKSWLACSVKADCILGKALRGANAIICIRYHKQYRWLVMGKIDGDAVSLSNLIWLIKSKGNFYAVVKKKCFRLWPHAAPLSRRDEGSIE